MGAHESEKEENETNQGGHDEEGWEIGRSIPKLRATLLGSKTHVQIIAHQLSRDYSTHEL